MVASTSSAHSFAPVSPYDAVTIDVVKGATATLAGSTVGKQNDSKCKVGGNSASDVLYEMRLLDAGDYALTLSAKFDSVLALRDTCLGKPVDCQNVSGLGGEVITYSVTATEAGKTIFVSVDGSVGANGTYVLSVEPPP